MVRGYAPRDRERIPTQSRPCPRTEWREGELLDAIKVQAEQGMMDEQFRQHLEHRHIPYGDFADLKSFHPSTFRTNRSTFAAYHRRMHGGYDYDHRHP